MSGVNSIRIPQFWVFYVVGNLDIDRKSQCHFVVWVEMHKANGVILPVSLSAPSNKANDIFHLHYLLSFVKLNLSNFKYFYVNTGYICTLVWCISNGVFFFNEIEFV